MGVPIVPCRLNPVKNKMTKKTKDQSALGYALMIYMCIVVVLISLVPFEFRIPESFHLTWSTNLADLVTNVLLFIPVGFLGRLTRRKGADFFCLQVIAIGLLLSFAVESAQVFIPGRYPQVTDVLTNGFGAWLGAISFAMLKKNLKERQPFKLLALELPLMNLVYLLIPLMWLNGLATGREGSRLWLMLMLGLMGGGVLASIYKSRFQQVLEHSFFKLSLFAMGWFFIAAIPAVINFPKQILFFGSLIGIFVQILARIPRREKNEERRFELPVLKRLLPFYAVYLLLLAAWPTTLPLEDWQYSINFNELAFNDRIVFIFRFIEYVGAFTLLGYMIAEMRGRKNESFEKTMGWAFFISAASAIFIESCEHTPPQAQSSTFYQYFILP